MSWNEEPIWGLRPYIYYCQTVAGLLTWGAFSDERTGLSSAIAAGPRQHSHSRVRVPWNSRQYFTVPDLRLPFRLLLRLAVLRWRYSTPPPHGTLLYNHFLRTEYKTPFPTILLLLWARLLIRYSETGSITPSFYCSVRLCCGRYLATAAVCRDTAEQRVYRPQYICVHIQT
jgi:hypothetical protein